jgi:hypothetical protein
MAKLPQSLGKADRCGALSAVVAVPLKALPAMPYHLVDERQHWITFEIATGTVRARCRGATHRHQRRVVAAAVPKGRSTAAQTALATLVYEAKQSGVMQKAIDAKGLKGVNVATK